MALQRTYDAPVVGSVIKSPPLALDGCNARGRKRRGKRYSAVICMRLPDISFHEPGQETESGD
jgi:hypothetical protein